ncbi:hypothetical protein JQ625_20620 [Bradyrhizobium diazoefficiens]|nr:hypothetical protein [Bradyrhizobium diazoefficiens]MBR0777250.1 hypothetical protein [Bradyrhizobium diazoefficiens]
MKRSRTVPELLSTVAPHRDPRGSALRACPVCADAMFAAQAAYASDHGVSYLWICDICRPGLVTKLAVKQRFACN